jgi:hypothetical protein
MFWINTVGQPFIEIAAVVVGFFMAAIPLAMLYQWFKSFSE